MDAQTNQPCKIAKALAAELEKDTLYVTPPPPWYRRRDVLLLALGLIGIVWTGVGLWSFAI